MRARSKELAADVVEDHVGPRLAGEALHLAHVVLLAREDHVVGAERPRPLGLVGEPVVAITFAPRSLQSWITIDDTPLPAAWTTTVWPGFTWALRKTICHAVSVQSGSAAASAKGRVADADHVLVGHVEVPRVPALRVLPEDAVAPAEVVASREADLADAAGEARLDHHPIAGEHAAGARPALRPCRRCRSRGGAGTELEGRAAAPHPEIHVVHRHGVHAHAHLVGPGRRELQRALLQHLGSAVTLQHHRFGLHHSIPSIIAANLVAAARRGHSFGSHIRNAVPVPRPVVDVISPPCASMIVRLSARPSPEPFFFAVTSGSKT